MDGTSRVALHTNLNNPSGITLDIDTQTLYWTDISANRLERSNTDGTDRELLTTTLIVDPYFITYYDGRLYWGDWYYNRLLSTSISNPSGVSFFGPSQGTDTYGIQVVAPERQRVGMFEFSHRKLTRNVCCCSSVIELLIVLAT